MYRKFLLSIMLAVTFTFASHYDLFFKDESNEFCVANAPYSLKMFNAKGKRCEFLALRHDVRIRIENPATSSNASLGIAVERPFFILDGIYLSTDGNRTLSDFEEEANRLGLMDVLLELGYTPILVQFTETVRTPLIENAKSFGDLLRFVNSNTFVEFPNKMESGMVIMGISQGGILGRYGAYLYDIWRSKKSDAPVRLYASLDSPHQGAVLPLSLYYTIDFWSKYGGSSEAEAFRDLIEGPGASGLLLYETEIIKQTFGGKVIFETADHKVNTSSERFLFGRYRKAAEYKGFPAVLVAQGQLKGTTPKHYDKYFTLNRRAKKSGMLMGRAESEMTSYNEGEQRIAKNRKYEKFGSTSFSEVKKDAKFDFVQGSTYPFAETIYNSLRAGFEEAMPKGMSASVLGVSTSISTGWDEDTLLQKNSTFIPTASAMDMKCSGNLAINEDCAFKQSSSGFPFAEPGSRSSADAVYAVDPTHPRYKESISGRHIEMPEKMTASENSAVVNGFQVDIWRILCELANYDYDPQKKAFRNENLAWYFVPNGNCMDQTKIPQVIRENGYVQTKKFGYARYDYAPKATEKNSSVRFDLPAGWHKVALLDYGQDLETGTAFEVDVMVNSSKGNWMKAELLLSKTKSGTGQIQLHEIDIPVNGKKFVARWQMPANREALAFYRWFRLILNSDGANVTLSNPRVVKSVNPETTHMEKAPKNVYPNVDVLYYAWPNSAKAVGYSDALGKGLSMNFPYVGNGLFLDFKEAVDMNDYSSLEVVYWPGTCQNTNVYFDSYRKSKVSLSHGKNLENMLVFSIPLEQVVDTRLTPDGGLSASRLSLQATAVNETCIIKSIKLK